MSGGAAESPPHHCHWRIAPTTYPPQSSRGLVHYTPTTLASTSDSSRKGQVSCFLLIMVFCVSLESSRLFGRFQHQSVWILWYKGNSNTVQWYFHDHWAGNDPLRDDGKIDGIFFFSDHDEEFIYVIFSEPHVIDKVLRRWHHLKFLQQWPKARIVFIFEHICGFEIKESVFFFKQLSTLRRQCAHWACKQHPSWRKNPKLPIIPQHHPSLRSSATHFCPFFTPARPPTWQENLQSSPWCIIRGALCVVEEIWIKVVKVVSIFHITINTFYSKWISVVAFNNTLWADWSIRSPSVIMALPPSPHTAHHHIFAPHLLSTAHDPPSKTWPWLISSTSLPTPLSPPFSPRTWLQEILPTIS